jgi:glycosyltransferase involved in cell wall biosynthesis
VDTIDDLKRTSFALPQELSGNDRRPGRPTPLLSVTVLTYQHADYIRVCLDGILMQQVEFPYEILVHDDASTDGTAQIVKEYALKYPDLVFPTCQTENQFAKGARPTLLPNMFRKCLGKYIALLEGDDYWTDPLKLQKQVDLLEAHEDYAGCSHNTNVIYEGSGKPDGLMVTGAAKDSYTIDDISKGQIYFHTSSMVYRNIFRNDFPRKYVTDYMGDWFLLMVHANAGPIGYIDSVMSVYRIHGTGMWSKLSEADQIERTLSAIMTFNRTFDYKYEDNFMDMFTRILSNLSKDKDHAFYERFFANTERPDLLKVINYAYKDIHAKDSAIRGLQESLDRKTEEMNSIYSAHADGDDPARSSGPCVALAYRGWLRHYVLFRRITQWIWRRAYTIYLTRLTTKSR